MDLHCLYDRRDELCLSFARKCTKSTNTQVRSMFPLNDNESNTRHREEYSVEMAHTERYKKSAVPYMQRLLNTNM